MIAAPFAAKKTMAAANLPSVSEWANQLFSRTSGAPLCAGNRVVLLEDAAENYPAWLQTIDGAHRTIHFEMYIVHEDAQGAVFAEALLRKAAEGVQVRVLYDWMGGFGKTSRAGRRRRRSGVHVSASDRISAWRIRGVDRRGNPVPRSGAGSPRKKSIDLR